MRQTWHACGTHVHVSCLPNTGVRVQTQNHNFLLPGGREQTCADEAQNFYIWVRGAVGRACQSRSSDSGSVDSLLRGLYVGYELRWCAPARAGPATAAAAAFQGRAGASSARCPGRCRPTLRRRARPRRPPPAAHPRRQPSALCSTGCTPGRFQNKHHRQRVWCGKCSALAVATLGSSAGFRCAMRLRSQRPDVNSKWRPSAQGPAPKARPQTRIIASASDLGSARCCCSVKDSDRQVRSAVRLRPQRPAVKFRWLPSGLCSTELRPNLPSRLNPASMSATAKPLSLQWQQCMPQKHSQCPYVCRAPLLTPNGRREPCAQLDGTPWFAMTCQRT